MTQSTEYRKWSARREMWRETLDKASDAWQLVANEWRETTDKDRKAELWAKYNTLWRERCIVEVYYNLAQIREYAEQFNLELPDLVIPDALFE